MSQDLTRQHEFSVAWNAKPEYRAEPYGSATIVGCPVQVSIFAEMQSRVGIIAISGLRLFKRMQDGDIAE